MQWLAGFRQPAGCHMVVRDQVRLLVVHNNEARASGQLQAVART